MSNDHLKYLLEKYAANASTPQETKELFGWIRRSKDDALLPFVVFQKQVPLSGLLTNSTSAGVC